MKTFFSKTLNFSKTIGNEQKHLKFLALNIRQCCQKVKLKVQNKKNGKQSSKNSQLLILAWLWEKNIQLFGRKGSATLSNLHSMCRKIKLREIKLCRKNCSDSISSDYELIFAGLFAKTWNLRLGCQNCNIHVQTDVLNNYFRLLFRLFLFLDFELKVPGF